MLICAASGGRNPNGNILFTCRLETPSLSANISTDAYFPVSSICRHRHPRNLRNGLRSIDMGDGAALPRQVYV